MTGNMRQRLIASLLLAAAAFQSPAPALAQAAAAKSAPAQATLAERLERLAAEFDRNRIDLHVPGAAIAIVRGDEIIFARGFGVADIEHKTPATPDTPFFIGSATKAFTAALVGMQVDAGRMKWDDSVDTYLPEFKLKVQSQNPDDRATLRDILSHRTGFTRMAFLESNTGLSSDEILRRAATAEPLAPFRQRFLYNNEQYLAAGSAVAVAAGAPWGELVQERILAPLGMTATRTAFRDAWNDPRTARGYWWDAANNKYQLVTLDTVGNNIEGIAPAGSISSTANDMTRWLRFLLRQGVQDGKPLISSSALSAMWTPQIQVGGGVNYGMGWFVRDWRGQRLIDHGGDVIGYSAEVGLLPDSNIGFVVLTNRLSTLPSIAMQLVPQYLFGDLPSATREVEDLKPYLGRYIANFATFSNEVFTVSERNGRLVLDIPSQIESALNLPGADGRRSLVMTDQLAVSFDRDETNKIIGLRLHESGLEFEVQRQGVQLKPEIPLDQLQRYVGRYTDPSGTAEFAILVRNQRLAVQLPNNASFDLLPPDATGRRATRTNLGIAVSFDESSAGAVAAMNFHPPGAAQAVRLTPVASHLPTVDEIVKLRRIPAKFSATTIRAVGSIRLPQSGVAGRYSSSAAGDDRFRFDMTIDGASRTWVLLDKTRAWRGATGGLTEELTGKEFAQVRLGATLSAALFGDWRKYYDAVRVVRASKLGDRNTYIIRLESAGLPPTLVTVDAETGDVLQTQQTIWSASGVMPSTTTYSDYREVGGMRIPYHYISSTDATGQIIFQVESAEVGVNLPANTFASPSTASVRGK